MTINWKIDYYDRTLVRGSPDPADEADDHPCPYHHARRGSDLRAPARLSAVPGLRRFAMEARRRHRAR